METVLHRRKPLFAGGVPRTAHGFGVMLECELFRRALIGVRATAVKDETRRSWDREEVSPRCSLPI